MNVGKSCVTIIELENSNVYRLFTKQPFKGAMVSSPFIQAKFKFQESLNIALDYYQSNSMYLNNSHILIRLIAGFVFDPETPSELLYRQIDSSKDRIASGLWITTDVNRGQIFEKAFYCSNCAIVSTSFSDENNLPHWKHIRAVRPFTHPHVSLNLVLPHRFKSIESTDYAVVGIDIALLAVQYQGWFKEQMLRPAVERDTIAMFVYNWVLPGMLPEQLDISLRNRFMYMLTGTWREEPELKCPIFIQDYDVEFDRAYLKIIRFLRTGKRRSLTEVMYGIPMFHAETYWESVPKSLDGLSIMSYWTRLLTYTDWLFPLANGFDNIDPVQELVTRKLKMVQRYVDGTHSDRFIEDAIYPEWETRYATIMERWG